MDGRDGSKNLDSAIETVAPMRLQRYLARAGIAPRRMCERHIADGRVTVNGQVVKHPGTKVDPSDYVAFDGQVVKMLESFTYLAFHKPLNVLCTNYDPHGGSYAIDCIHLPYPIRLFTVGRLDRDSSGLIFITNDGDFSQIVQHPSMRIEKEYIVHTSKPIKRSILRQFKAGVTIEGIRYMLSSYRQIDSTAAALVLQEGRKREIRVVLDHFGLTVERLHRIRIGHVLLGNTPPGRWFSLERSDIDTFMHNRWSRIDGGSN